MGFFDRLQNIDRRVLYLLLILAVGLPLIFSAPVPAPAVLPPTRSFYDTVEALANDPVRRNKLVILSANFSSSTAAESLTQTDTVMRHLMRRKLKFAIFDFVDPQGRELAQQTAEKLQNQYGYVYGRDYVNWGYRPVGAAVPTVKAMVRDIPAAIGRDITNTPLTEIPVMEGVKGVNDIAAVIEVTGSASLPVWIGYFQRTGREPVPTLFCTTAVQGPEAFPLLKSGQLQGMLVGLQGAAEYEVLLKEPGFATRGSASLSYAHFLILALIILGNVSMLLSRSRSSGSGTGGTR